MPAHVNKKAELTINVTKVFNSLERAICPFLRDSPNACLWVFGFILAGLFGHLTQPQ